MNNLKLIREIYGATQDEIATAINVNRATISIWENNDEKRASNTSLEKLSLFYGIGPEFFYEQPVDDTARQILTNSAKRQKELEAKNDSHRNKAEEFHQLLSTISFDAAIKDYMVAMKIFLTTLDEGSLEKLETALKINQKMGKRLEAEIELKKKEQVDNEESLTDLLDSFTTEE
ncbi:MAG: helix-turn-helix transcriptional regulator [Lachnospiraceae bacterium]|nr:helix-turn-helix transcriptional regulator [Lachnospiraceae bacterium]